MATSNFDECFAALKNAANRQCGPEPSPDLRRALNAFATLTKGERQAAMTAVADMLAELTSPTGAGVLALWLGAAVEGGRDPELSCRPIVETFLRWSRTVETAPEPGGDDEDFEDDPEPDEETIAGLQKLGQSLVAHLSRASGLRKWLAETGEIYREFERVEHLSYGATWVIQLLRQRSGELVVLNVAQKKGVLARYENIANCFHLFTLLQGALIGVMPDARDTPEKLLSFARGNPTNEDVGSDSAWWHFGQGNVAEPDIAASIWGEGGPDEISRIDGT